MKKVITITLIVLSLALFGCDSKKNDYEDALAVFINGDYETAYELFTELGDYQDSVEKAHEAKYRIAEKYYEEGDYEKAISTFSDLSGYKDSLDRKEKIQQEVYYNRAIEEANNGNRFEAILLLRRIRNNLQAEELLSNLQFEDEIEKLSHVKIGSVVSFGTYDQNADSEDGKEEIRWIVIDKKQNDVLLISESLFMAKPYNVKDESTTWEKSSLRQFLNNSFIDTSFNEKEKALIQKSQVSTDGVVTEDSVFILSIEETERYFPEALDRITTSTQSAAEDGIYKIKESAMWWLRDQGNKPNMAAHTTATGEINSKGDEVYSNLFGDRPVMWISLDSLGIGIEERDLSEKDVYEDVMRIVRNYLFDYDPVVEYDDVNKMINIKVNAPSGTANAMVIDKDAIRSSWNEYCESLRLLTASSYFYAQENGYRIACTVMVLSDANSENAFYAAMNGVEIMNEINK